MQRFYFYTQFKLGKSPRVIYQQLATVWGDKSAQYCSIARWCEKIRNNDFLVLLITSELRDLFPQQHLKM